MQMHMFRNLHDDHVECTLSAHKALNLLILPHSQYWSMTWLGLHAHARSMLGPVATCYERAIRHV